MIEVGSGQENREPVAEFVTTIGGGVAENHYIDFIDASRDEDGHIVYWWWEFGDDTISIEQNPMHNYERPGIYQVALTVFDDDFAQDTVVRMITVR
jgi:PKD repeat protein